MATYSCTKEESSWTTAIWPTQMYRNVFKKLYLAQTLFPGKLMSKPMPGALKNLLHETFAQHVPQLKSKPRASYISESTWNCRQAKGIARKQLKCIWLALTTCWRLWAFTAWKHGQLLQWFYRPHLRWLFHWECSSAKLHKGDSLLDQPFEELYPTG